MGPKQRQTGFRGVPEHLWAVIVRTSTLRSTVQAACFRAKTSICIYIASPSPPHTPHCRQIGNSDLAGGSLQIFLLHHQIMQHAGAQQSADGAVRLRWRVRLRRWHRRSSISGSTCGVDTTGIRGAAVATPRPLPRCAGSRAGFGSPYIDDPPRGAARHLPPHNTLRSSA